MENKYSTFLNENGLKCTPQRCLILDIVDKNGHIDIDTLYSIVKKQYSTISLSTIYKNINLMTEKNVLSEVKIPNHKVVYETKKKEHIHFHCQYCGKIYDMEIKDDIDLSFIKNFNKKSVENINLFLGGKCEEC